MPGWRAGQGGPVECGYKGRRKGSSWWRVWERNGLWESIVSIIKLHSNRTSGVACLLEGLNKARDEEALWGDSQGWGDALTGPPTLILRYRTCFQMLEANLKLDQIQLRNHWACAIVGDHWSLAPYKAVFHIFWYPQRQPMWRFRYNISVWNAASCGIMETGSLATGKFSPINWRHGLEK